MKKIIAVIIVILFIFIIPAYADTTVYITNTGAKYHNSNCSYLSKSKISISLPSAINQGYTPCSRCKPPTAVETTKTVNASPATSNASNSNNVSNEEIEGLEKVVSNKQETIERLEKNVSNKQGTIDGLEKSVTAKQDTIKKLNEEIENLKNEINKKGNPINLLTTIFIITTVILSIKLFKNKRVPISLSDEINNQ